MRVCFYRGICFVRVCEWFVAGIRFNSLLILEKCLCGDNFTMRVPHDAGIHLSESGKRVYA